jgi:pyruvate/2-oxoacid:ferredoxin oxidoreductase beta subunit
MLRYPAGHLSLLQMFGERLVIANACGCSSVWGSWEPSNPYTVSLLGCLAVLHAHM